MGPVQRGLGGVSVQTLDVKRVEANSEALTAKFLEEKREVEATHAVRLESPLQKHLRRRLCSVGSVSGECLHRTGRPL